MANDFRVIFQGANEAATRYGGGGGDAGAGPRNGGAGGSGILIIRYVKG